MPCRLNDGLHEWRNEIVTVPTKNLPNTLSRCKSRGLQVGSKDPVELYCSLLLWSILYFNKEPSGAREVLVGMRLAAYLYMRNSSWWAVWLGWHPVEKISTGLKGWLMRFGNSQ